MEAIEFKSLWTHYYYYIKIPYLTLWMSVAPSGPPSEKKEEKKLY